MKKKTPKTKSEPKSERASLLTEHDHIEQQLAKLKAQATANDEINTTTVEKATAVYAAAVKKAEIACEAAITKAKKALTDATAKANKVNNAERDIIAAKNGPLKRRLQFLKSEINREFALDRSLLPGAPRTASEACGSTREYDRVRSVMYPSDLRIPTTWIINGVWERRRVGNTIQLRRPRG